MNYKGILNELCMTEKRDCVFMTKSEGLQHEITFTSCFVFNSKLYVGEAAKTVKKAEQNCAKKVIETLNLKNTTKKERKIFIITSKLNTSIIEKYISTGYDEICKEFDLVDTKATRNMITSAIMLPDFNKLIEQSNNTDLSKFVNGEIDTKCKFTDWRSFSTLGDSVIKHILTIKLFADYQNEEEISKSSDVRGYITTNRSKLESREHLNKIMVESIIFKYILNQNLRIDETTNIAGEILESFVGALSIIHNFSYEMTIKCLKKLKIIH